MRTLFLQDKIAQKILGNDFDAIFAKKNNKGEYDRKPIKTECGKDVDSILPLLKRGIEYIVAELGRNNQYYNELTQEIKFQIANSGSDLLKLDSLCDLTKIISSELINRGFSQSYIYDCIKQIFFDSSHPVSTIDVVDDFFNCFSSRQNKYCIYLPLNSIKQKSALEDYGLFKISENIYEMFSPAIPYILKYDCESSDPYKAREQARQLINFCLSVNQFIKHNKYEYNPKYAEVVDKQTQVVTFIRKPELPIAHGHTRGEELEVNDLLDACLKLNAGVFQVLQLHSSALTSKNVDNQLINLWTAVEVAVPIIRKDNLSRINQISNVLTAALGQDYFSVLAHQLFLDIKTIDDNAANIIETIDFDGESNFKLLAVLLLQKYHVVYDEVSRLMVQAAPLLACRMHRYKTQWSNTSVIKKIYQSHSERLSQQIMRIYRTRNMLVHDGSSLPYIDYVLQNLHYYVDSFVRFLSLYYRFGYRSIQTIIDAVQFQEQTYIQSLSVSEDINEINITKYIH